MLSSKYLPITSGTSITCMKPKPWYPIRVCTSVSAESFTWILDWLPLTPFIAEAPPTAKISGFVSSLFLNNSRSSRLLWFFIGILITSSIFIPRSLFSTYDVCDFMTSTHSIRITETVNCVITRTFWRIFPEPAICEEVPLSVWTGSNFERYNAGYKPAIILIPRIIMIRYTLKSGLWIIFTSSERFIILLNPGRNSSTTATARITEISARKNASPKNCEIRLFLDAPSVFLTPTSRAFFTLWAIVMFMKFIHAIRIIKAATSIKTNTIL